MTDYDSPWKNVLDRYFPEFLAFFFPVVHAGINWSQGYIFLDKELQKVVRDAVLGRRWADKLARVTGRDGVEDWVLVHIEVQGEDKSDFAQRMFVYNYRLYELPPEFRLPRVDGSHRNLKEERMKKIPKQEYTTDFKDQAAKRAAEVGVGAASRELGLVEQTLRNGVKAAKAGAFHPGTKVVTPDQMEISRLRAENARLRIPVEILKKATAYFAKSEGLDTQRHLFSLPEERPVGRRKTRGISV